MLFFCSFSHHSNDAVRLYSSLSLHAVGTVLLEEKRTGGEGEEKVGERRAREERELSATLFVTGNEISIGR